MLMRGAPREPGIVVSGSGVMAVSRSRAKKKENQGKKCDHKSHFFLTPACEAIRASGDVVRLPLFSSIFA